MKIGTLVPQRDTGRMDIRFSPNNYYGGLHCGETLDVKINGRWVSTRIEMGNDVCLLRRLAGQRQTADYPCRPSPFVSSRFSLARA